MNNEVLINLITASVSPAVMISGVSMLVLAFLGRQGILAGRLRELHEKALYHAEQSNKEKFSYHNERAKLCMQQAKEVYSSARTVKWTLIFLFSSIISFVITSIGLGGGVFLKKAIAAATFFFVLGVANLLIAALVAMSGVLKSLTPLKHEQIETEKLIEQIGK